MVAIYKVATWNADSVYGESKPLQKRERKTALQNKQIYIVFFQGLLAIARKYTGADEWLYKEFKIDHPVKYSSASSFSVIISLKLFENAYSVNVYKTL